MSAFDWAGGPLDDPSSWTPQPPPPNPPVIPGPADDAFFAGGGSLTGSLGVADARFTAGSFDLQGAITATFNINLGADTGSSATDLTIEAGASFTTGGEQLGGQAAATITQKAGNNTLTGAGSALSIGTGSSYDLQGGTVSVPGYLALGNFNLAGGTGTFTQSGGMNTVFGIINNLGSYELDAGTLSVGAGNEFVGDNLGAAASFIQKGGTHTVNGDLAIGDVGDGTFTLSDGVLSGVAEFIGQNSTGTFVQTGGTHTMSDRIVLGINLNGTNSPSGTGSYTLGGTGSLIVQTIFIGSDPGCTATFDFNQAGGDAATLQISGTGGFPGLIVGGEGTGTFNQGHGDLNTTLVVGRKSTGDGTYNFTDGTLTSTDEKVGGEGKGTFVHNNGTNTVNGTGLVVGSAATATGTYDLNNGSLVAVGETIGDQGNGTLAQNGGTNSITPGDLIIGNADGGDGTYVLSNGTLNVVTGGITLGAQVNSTGTFELNTTIGNAGAITIGSQTLTVGDAGDGNFIQGSGTLNADVVVASQFSATGTFELDAGTLTSTGQTVGDAGAGTFIHKGGANTITDNGLVLGNSSGGSGTYNLGAKAQLAILAGNLTLGNAGNSTGTFNFNTAKGDAAKLTIKAGVIQVGFHGAAQFNQAAGKLKAKVIVGSQVGSHGTYELAGGSVSSFSQVVGDDGTGTFQQDGGTNKISGGGDLILGSVSLGSGTYRLNRGKLSASGELIGNDGAGSFVQTGGTHLINGGKSAVLALGTQSDGTGTYELDGGTLTVGTSKITSQEIIGNSGKATFTQKGGVNHVIGRSAILTVAALSGSTGGYELDAGALTSPNQIIGGVGQGTFTQTGGTNTIANTGKLIVGASPLGTGTYKLTDGRIATGSETIGKDGSGSFIQTGGTNLVNGTTTAALTLGSKSDGIGTFELDTGTLTIGTSKSAGKEIVGGSGKGTFIQQGGTNRIAGGTAALQVGALAGGVGTFELDVGTVSVAGETIGDAGQGTFTLKGGLDRISGGTIALLTLGSHPTGVGTFELDAGTLNVGTSKVAGQEIVGSSGKAAFTQTGGSNIIAASGDLVLGSIALATGTYALSNGRVSAGSEMIGKDGSGSFIQTGGTNLVNGTITAVLAIGGQADGSGTFELDAGTLTVGTSKVAGQEIVGESGKATFTQKGGVDRINGTTTAVLTLGSQSKGVGTFEFDAGTLTVGTSTTPGQEVIGAAGNGTFIQNGGTNTVANGGELIVGSSSLASGTYKLSNGRVTVSNELIGKDGSGSFVQTGGTNLLSGTIAAVLTLGSQSDGSGTFELDAGTLTVGSSKLAGQEVVGNSGKAAFTQKGGTNLIAGNGGTLLVGELIDATGTYELDAGKLTSGGEIIGDKGNGSFTQTGGTNTVIGGDLLVGVNGTGSYILSGGSLMLKGNALQKNVEIVLGGSSSAPAGGSGTIAVGGGGQIMVGSTLAVWQGSTVSVFDGKSGIDIGTSGSVQAGDILVESTRSLLGNGAVDAAVRDNGSIIATNSGTVALSNGGTLEITGAVSGTGSLTLAAGAALRLDGTVGNHNTISFNSGIPERLILGNPGTRFASTISNLSNGDVIEFGNGMTITSASMKHAGTVTVDFHTASGPDKTYRLTDVNFAAGAKRTFRTGHDALTGLDFIAVTCFAAGTCIATARGNVAVEQLRDGDRVKVMQGAPQQIIWIGRRHVDCRRHARPDAVWPVRVAAGAFGHGRPRRDLYLSPDHAVYAMRVLIPVKHLINDKTIVQLPVDEVTYYHVELPRHHVLLAEGLPVESYLDSGDRSNFTNGSAALALHPDFSSRAWEASGCAPLVVTGAEVTAVRRLLARYARRMNRRQRETVAGIAPASQRRGH